MIIAVSPDDKEMLIRIRATNDLTLLWSMIKGVPNEQNVVGQVALEAIASGSGGDQTAALDVDYVMVVNPQ